MLIFCAACSAHVVRKGNGGGGVDSVRRRTRSALQRERTAVKVMGRVALLIVLAGDEDAVGAEERTHPRGSTRWRKRRRSGWPGRNAGNRGLGECGDEARGSAASPRRWRSGDHSVGSRRGCRVEPEEGSRGVQSGAARRGETARGARRSRGRQGANPTYGGFKLSRGAIGDRRIGAAQGGRQRAGRGQRRRGKGPEGCTSQGDR